jgi:hypothetical protein
MAGVEGRVSYIAYLDSPEEGRGFSELYPTLEPGEDIAVSTELAYRGGEAALKACRRRTAAVNSLYYSKEGGGVRCFVANERHIINEALNPLWEFINLAFQNAP